MSSLDDLLTKVGPILNSSQFSHPSFREILAARQFAEEINSGRLSVNDAYLNLWSEPPMFDASSVDLRMIRSEWRQVLNHLSPILSDNATNALIRIISDKCFMYEKRFGFSSTGGISWAVLEDLSFCAKVIGDHASLRSDEGVKPIIDILMDVVYNCSRSKCVHEFQDDPYYSFAKSALIKTNSGYAAGRLLAYSSFLGHIPVSEYSSPGKKENLERQASIALEILVKGGAKIDESALIESVGSRKDINSGDIGLLLEYGGVKSFRYVMEMLAVNDLPDHDSCKDGRFFNLLLHGIKKYKFEPKMIGHFNDMVSKIASDDDAINNYYKSLSFFAKFFKPLFGEDLYDYLETKGIQFFNSWVYKPK